MRRVNILALQDSLLSPQATTIDWLAGLVPVNVMDLKLYHKGENLIRINVAQQVNQTLALFTYGMRDYR